MKTSIKQLFGSLHFHIVMIILLILAVGAIGVSAKATFVRIDNLDRQKNLVEQSLILNKDDLKYAQIKADGIVQQLPILISELESSSFFAFLNDIYIKDGHEKLKQIGVIKVRYESFAKKVKLYFFNETGSAPLRIGLQQSVDRYILALQPLLLIETTSLHYHFIFFSIGLIILLVWSLFLLAAARNVSGIITNDIQNAVMQESSRSSYKYRTLELNSLALKLRQQSDDTALASQKDPLTMLLNYDGLQKSFSQRYAKTKGSHIHLCLFEIDNYTKLANHYPESVLEPIILKITSILKLHKQQNDLLARIGANQFLAVFIRAEKQKAFKDADHIRQMVEDNRFKLPHSSIPITLSGGFATKSSAQTLDDTFKNTKEYLAIALNKGGNTIAQLKDNTKVI